MDLKERGIWLDLRVGLENLAIQGDLLFVLSLDLSDPLENQLRCQLFDFLCASKPEQDLQYDSVCGLLIEQIASSYLGEKF